MRVRYSLREFTPGSGGGGIKEMCRETSNKAPNIIRAAAYIPCCPTHEVAMIEYSWLTDAIYFRCPVESCAERNKAARVDFIPRVITESSKALYSALPVYP